MIHKKVQKFQGELVEQKKNGYLRIRVRGLIRDGFPSDIDLKPVELLVDEDPQLLWVDVNTLGVEMPLQARSPEREKIDVGEFFSSFGDFAQSIKEMHGLVWETLEEEASVTTGLLTPSQRSFLVEEWVRRFESRNFSEEEG